MADSIAADLKQHIYRTYANGPRRNSRWVMGPAWFNDLRRMEDAGDGVTYHPGLRVGSPEMLLGIPVEVREDGGVPHLEGNE